MRSILNERDRAEIGSRVRSLSVSSTCREGEGPAHPLFGPMTWREWGVATYKHTDHHLRQFGA